MFLKRMESEVYAISRIVVGFLFLWHGTQKVLAIPMASPYDLPWHVQYIAGPLELVGGLFIMLGLFTHWTAFVCSGLMAVAYWMAHGHKALLPLQNNGELAALYCFVFLLIAAYGSGIWSIDSLRSRKANATSVVN